jgi:hypothetical protein
MHTRTLWNTVILVLLIVLTMEAVGMSRSLRRIEHEERRVVTQCAAMRLGTPVFYNFQAVTPFAVFDRKLE